MHNCSKEMVGFHDDNVTLPQSERTEMRDRRDANRNRLKNGLEKNENPLPRECATQGSYAMKTMIQRPRKDYDIDDGAYFKKEDLVGPAGGDISALDARKMVRDALDDGNFKTAPEVRTNCVRVYYNAGYHVDMPVYRIVTETDSNQEEEYYELASSEWQRSDARDVTQWFDDENKSQSPDDTNGRQLRRMTRFLKYFSKSRPSWTKKILSGFGITKLVTERYRGDANREDISLYDTMKAIRDRLDEDLVIEHPVTPDATITDGDDDPKARFLRDKLSDAIEWLDILFQSGCTREEALKAWDKVFNTTYFSDQDADTKGAQNAGPTILTSGMLKEQGTSQEAQSAVRKKGGGRYA